MGKYRDIFGKNSTERRQACNAAEGGTSRKVEKQAEAYMRAVLGPNSRRAAGLFAKKEEQPNEPNGDF